MKVLQKELPLDKNSELSLDSQKARKLVLLLDFVLEFLLEQVKDSKMELELERDLELYWESKKAQA